MDATTSRSIAKFAILFCNELEKDKTSVCSPLSAETVLALLALGCRGQTQAELLQALDLPDDNAIRSLFKSLTPKLQNMYGATLNTANKVYMKEGGTLKPELKKLVMKAIVELEKDKTSVCSPLSAETVLALLALGCRGQTQAELLQALDLPDDNAIRSLFKSLTPKLQNMYGATLNTANKVYMKEGGTLKPELKKDAEKVFGAELEQLDFKDSVAAANVINQWVAENTNGRIKEIVSADMMGERTSLFVVNAIYFKASWKKKFRVYDTWTDKFHVDNVTAVDVPMMCMQDQTMMYGYNSKLKAKFLEMPYQSVYQSSMVFVLPDEIEGLSNVLLQLAAGHDLMADIEAMKDEALDIRIPRFKAETKIDLKDLLQKLGIERIFNEATSEIDMLTSSERLCVSHAVQKAYIMVNESGTEAAAATGFSEVRCCATVKPPLTPFKADRPFLFLLRARTVPVFVGVYRNGQETIPSKADFAVEVAKPAIELFSKSCDHCCLN